MIFAKSVWFLTFNRMLLKAMCPNLVSCFPFLLNLHFCLCGLLQRPLNWALTHPIHCCRINAVRLAIPCLLCQKWSVLAAPPRALWLVLIFQHLRKISLPCGYLCVCLSALQDCKFLEGKHPVLSLRPQPSCKVEIQNWSSVSIPDGLHYWYFTWQS